jgi:hypothetical protein
VEYLDVGLGVALVPVDPVRHRVLAGGKRCEPLVVTKALFILLAFWVNKRFTLLTSAVLIGYCRLLIDVWRMGVLMPMRQQV